MDKKRKRNLMILGLIWVLIAVVFLVIGFAIADGWEAVGAWFSGKWAMMIYTFLGVYALVIIIYVVFPMIKERL